MLNPRTKLVGGLLIGLSGFLSSCSSKKSKDADLSQQSEKPAIQSPQRFRPSQQGLEILDITGDGFPRIKRIYSGESGRSPLQRIEVDFNADGRIDMIQIMDPSGQWVSEERVDLNGNGSMDAIYRYVKDSPTAQPRLLSQEFDARYTGQMTLWKYFNERGELVRREIDRRGSGRPDYWEYFENGRLVRSDQDLDGDGQPDSLPKIRRVVRPSGPNPTRTQP